jgi:hypothetical protein
MPAASQQLRSAAPCQCSGSGRMVDYLACADCSRCSLHQTQCMPSMRCINACMLARDQSVSSSMPVQQLGAHGGLLGMCGLQQMQPAPNPAHAKHEVHQCMHARRISAWRHEKSIMHGIDATVHGALARCMLVSNPANVYSLLPSCSKSSSPLYTAASISRLTVEPSTVYNRSIVATVPVHCNTTKNLRCKDFFPKSTMRNLQCAEHPPQKYTMNRLVHNPVRGRSAITAVMSNVRMTRLDASTRPRTHEQSQP